MGRLFVVLFFMPKCVSAFFHRIFDLGGLHL